MKLGRIDIDEFFKEIDNNGLDYAINRLFRYKWYQLIILAREIGLEVSDTESKPSTINLLRLHFLSLSCDFIKCKAS